MIRSPHLVSLRELLPVAERGGYAVGAFSPRYTALIGAVLRAGQAARSPLIVQISQKELARYGITPAQFAGVFFERLTLDKITVPVALHLDHTKDFAIIAAAIAAGFSSVMIDASEQPLDENIARSRRVAEYAHGCGVAVEAELGRIGSADLVETDSDEELFTRPEEAQRFVEETGVDALAVSVGTAHGVYTVRQPRIDLERLRQIRARTPVPLVLHGGSGVPAEMMRAAIRLPGGGISKVNIATDLELAALAAVGREKYLLDAEMSALPVEQLAKAQAAVEQVVIEKIACFVGSLGKGSLG
jgi:fructose-bisphosphate aldolase class II